MNINNLVGAVFGYFQKTKVSRISKSVQVFILGPQKSGSTIIAASLAELTDQSVTLDISRSIKDPEWKVQLSKGHGSFDDYLYMNRRDFTSSIIKEPGLTFFYSELKDRFPRARYVMTMRHPADSIRSVLNRLGLPGSLSYLDIDAYPLLRASPAWKINLDGSWLGIDSEHYIEVLASRWLIAAQLYLKSSHQFSLIKYEDFCEDKVGSIYRLCVQLGLTPIKDITHFVDTQFQPPGQKTSDYLGFFGEENYRRIVNICENASHSLGYEMDL